METVWFFSQKAQRVEEETNKAVRRRGRMAQSSFMLHVNIIDFTKNGGFAHFISLLSHTLYFMRWSKHFPALPNTPSRGDCCRCMMLHSSVKEEKSYCWVSIRVSERLLSASPELVVITDNAVMMTPGRVWSSNGALQLSSHAITRMIHNDRKIAEVVSVLKSRGQTDFSQVVVFVLPCFSKSFERAGLKLNYETALGVVPPEGTPIWILEKLCHRNGCASGLQNTYGFQITGRILDSFKAFDSFNHDILLQKKKKKKKKKHSTVVLLESLTIVSIIYSVVC